MNDVFNGFEVTQEIQGAHPRMPEYRLLPGDLVLLDDDGTMRKIAPGLAIGMFDLSIEQKASLKPVQYMHDGHLGFTIVEEGKKCCCDDEDMFVALSCPVHGEA